MRMIAFDVYLKGKHIDTVFYDADMSALDVRRSLIDHDGYNECIIVYRCK